ncbi:phosphoglycerate dehydrogenase-like enzyme [Rhodococcus sp. 27YEA15]|uniref:D-isomer specific 2-hydroxyacid dehydrogenase family protein n=1 Tax=Rhodococcus sp. 27YEA15 TaxID=3156259 RepID=UPI003C7AE9BF
MAIDTTPRVAIGPAPDALLESAVVRGGGLISPIESADAVVWTGSPESFPTALPSTVRWVQLSSAGIEEWFGAGVIRSDTELVWTSAAGAFSATVAEHALMLLLAGVRHLPAHIEARTWRRAEFMPKIGTLRGATVGIIGAGGIGKALIPMLAAQGADSIAINRSGNPVPGAVETWPTTRVDELYSRADHFVIAAPATATTHHLIGRAQLAAMQPHSWVINVARGSLIDTDALVEAITEERIGGAGLDVTDPEPLPDGHPLWELTNAIITPHDSNPGAIRHAALAEHIGKNVERFARGETLAALVNPIAGY